MDEMMMDPSHSLIWEDGRLFSLGGQVLMGGSLDRCAREFEGFVIKVTCYSL